MDVTEALSSNVFLNDPDQRCAIYIATYRWPSISRVLRHIVVYLMYIEEHCLKFIVGVVLITCFYGWIIVDVVL